MTAADLLADPATLPDDALPVPTCGVEFPAPPAASTPGCPCVLPVGHPAHHQCAHNIKWRLPSDVAAPKAPTP